MNRYYFEEAIVLKNQRIRDSDLLLTIYGRSKGKYNVIAPGALKFKNRLRGKIELFSWGKGYFIKRKSLDWLINWEIKDIFWNIRTNFEKLNSALSIISIVERNTPWENPDENLFNIVINILKLIKENNSEFFKEIFFIRYIQSQGLIDKFSTSCNKCGKVFKNEIVRINIIENKVYCKNCSFSGVAISLETLQNLNKILDLPLEESINLNLSKIEFENLMREYEKTIE
ncbi:MAG: DNA repair protein RecO [Dictyoglomus sp.]|nr:DNA repair protein RecO [Dictyoglomus sp.]MCX7941670.1 DNA repair protein RecO [Dictyoglomaceae bacterium]MDW8188178.1 DNA repair protein RecO [Dictyoglomus sp.]